MEQIKQFLEKLFVYGRDEFERIAEFFPHKNTKDVVSLYYGLKKHLKLREGAAELGRAEC